MTTEDVFACYWQGKDAVPGDKCPYEPGTQRANAWQHGFAAEHGVRRPMTDDEVAEAFAALLTRRITP